MIDYTYKRKLSCKNSLESIYTYFYEYSLNYGYYDPICLLGPSTAVRTKRNIVVRLPPAIQWALFQKVNLCASKILACFGSLISRDGHFTYSNTSRTLTAIYLDGFWTNSLTFLPLYFKIKGGIEKGQSVTIPSKHFNGARIWLLL